MFIANEPRRRPIERASQSGQTGRPVSNVASSYADMFDAENEYRRSARGVSPSAITADLDALETIGDDIAALARSVVHRTADLRIEPHSLVVSEVIARLVEAIDDQFDPAQWTVVNAAARAERSVSPVASSCDSTAARNSVPAESTKCSALGALEWSQEGRLELIAAYVQAQLDMGEVIKTAFNPEFGHKYASLSAVTGVVLPAMNNHGLAVIQSPSSDGETLTLETMIVHSGGGWMRSRLTLRPPNADPQGMGSATTYARRYALMALAGVAPEDDDGNAAGCRPPLGGESAAADAAAAPNRRKTSAQAKRDGDYKRIFDEVAATISEDQLDRWFASFQLTEAFILPRSWADAITDMVESRRNDLRLLRAEVAA